MNAPRTKPGFFVTVNRGLKRGTTHGSISSHVGAFSGFNLNVVFSRGHRLISHFLEHGISRKIMNEFWDESRRSDVEKIWNWEIGALTGVGGERRRGCPGRWEIANSWGVCCKRPSGWSSAPCRQLGICTFLAGTPRSPVSGTSRASSPLVSGGFRTHMNRPCLKICRSYNGRHKKKKPKLQKTHTETN